MKIAVIGAGGWGTALAVLLSQNKHKVSLWRHNQKLLEEMIRTRENKPLLPGIKIPTTVKLTASLEEALLGADIVVLAVPSQFFRTAVTQTKYLSLTTLVMVSVSKGIEIGSLKRMSEIVVEELPENIRGSVVVLSGPSHAEEVSREIPTTVVAASSDTEAARMVQTAFMTPSFRVYTNTDIVGVELGGALKNVIALASGISDGLGFGDNTKGALITRGLAEISRLGVTMGADPATFAGLSGMGDLITTCISHYSRNRYVGEEIGKGRSLDDIFNKMVKVAEGVPTTESAFQLSSKFNVEMPITEQVHAVIFEGRNPKEAVSELMLREAKPERWN